MTFDYELTLIKKTYKKNSMKNSIPTETRRTVLCDQESVTRSEHYAAAANNLKPQIVFVINKYEYEGESEVEFEGNRYNVIRTFAQKKSKSIEDYENIELVCSGVS